MKTRFWRFTVCILASIFVFNYWGFAREKELPDALTLQDCLKIAVGRNRALLISRAKTKGAKARQAQVVSAQLPSGSAQAYKITANQPSSSISGTDQQTQKVVLSDTFQPFGRYQSQKRAADKAVKASLADEKRVENDTAFQVVKTFYDILLAQELIKIASESVDQLTRHRNETQTMVDAGSVPKFDLLRAEVQLSSVQPNLIKARHSIKNYLADLQNILGLDPTYEPTLIGSFPQDVRLPPDETSCMEFALKKRPDLISAIAAAENAAFQLKAARQGFQPTLQLSNTWERNKGYRPPLNQDRYIMSTQVGLVFPFLDSGLTREKSREAGSALEQAKLNQDAVVSALKVDVKKSTSGLIEASEVVKSQEKNVEQAREALNIAEIAYRTGAKTSLDVLDAQVALTQALTLWYQALHGRAVAFSQLQRSVGITPGYEADIGLLSLKSSTDDTAK